MIMMPLLRTLVIAAAHRTCRLLALHRIDATLALSIPPTTPSFSGCAPCSTRCISYPTYEPEIRRQPKRTNM
jgi:hypothetical protein